MQKAVFACLILVATAALMAQELPPPFPRPNATKLFENDRINVWDIVWPRGQPTALHRHIYDQVGTYYQRGGRVITTADGEERSNLTEVGSLSTTRKGTTHVEEGNSNPPLRAVFIELKQKKPSGLTPAEAGAVAFPREGARQVLPRRPRHHVGLCIVGGRTRSTEISSGTRDGHRRIHRARAWTCPEDYFTRSKTRCDAIEPIMPSIVMVLPSALRVVLDVPVPPGPATEPS
jgi:hypothetical protein